MLRYQIEYRSNHNLLPIDVYTEFSFERCIDTLLEEILTDIVAADIDRPTGFAVPDNEVAPGLALLTGYGGLTDIGRKGCNGFAIVQNIRPFKICKTVIRIEITGAQ